MACAFLVPAKLFPQPQLGSEDNTVLRRKVLEICGGAEARLVDRVESDREVDIIRIARRDAQVVKLLPCSSIDDTRFFEDSLFVERRRRQIFKTLTEIIQERSRSVQLSVPEINNETCTALVLLPHTYSAFAMTMQRCSLVSESKLGMETELVSDPGQIHVPEARKSSVLRTCRATLV